MIRKFQLGGQQEQALMLFVQGLALTLQTDPQLIVQIAQLNPEALQIAVLTYQQTQDMGQAAQAFLQALQLKTQAAKHGAKLQYLKSLKNKCAEDEELYYYKKGGSVTCGCKKKENGGEVTKASNGWQANFKNRKRTKAEQDKINKQSEEDYFNGTADHNMNPKASKLKREEPELPKVTKPKVNSTSKPARKDSSKIMAQKCGAKMKKDACGSKVVKAFKEKCGAKMKKHQLGGSLNRIPFMLEGSPKDGITTKNGVKIVLPEYMLKTQIGYPSILPGRYSGLERISPNFFSMFKTWIKGLPKSISTSDKVAIGAGTVIGNALGYDDTHNLYIRKSINNVSKGLNPTMEWTPFSADNIINNFINRPLPKKFKK